MLNYWASLATFGEDGLFIHTMISPDLFNICFKGGLWVRTRYLCRLDSIWKLDQLLGRLFGSQHVDWHRKQNSSFICAATMHAQALSWIYSFNHQVTLVGTLEYLVHTTASFVKMVNVLCDLGWTLLIFWLLYILRPVLVTWISLG
jgi:uncharacterized Tic20 family protein